MRLRHIDAECYRLIIGKHDKRKIFFGKKRKGEAERENEGWNKTFVIAE